MSSFAHTQGGLRPAYINDPPFHPGLQVHAIAEPRANTRLSFLISALCYTVMAGVVVFTLQNGEAIVEQIRITHGDVLLDPVEAVIASRPEPALPVAPANAVPAQPDVPVPAARVVEPNLDTLPQSLPTANQRQLTGGNGAKGGVLGANPGNSDPVGIGVLGGHGQVTEISMAQVQILHQVEPVYPPMARIIRAQGDVVLRMTIDTAGVPSEVKIVSGHDALRAEALRCARQWRFTPARMGGEVVPAAFNLTVRFILR